MIILILIIFISIIAFFIIKTMESLKLKIDNLQERVIKLELKNDIK